MRAASTARSSLAATTVVSRRLTGPLLLVSMLFAPDSAWALEVRTILESTAVSPPARVDFREERHNVMFREPLVLTGYLEYLKAGTLRKVVETPFEESFLIESDQVVVRRNGETRTLPMRRSKSLQTILGAIEAILSGDADKLESVFDLDCSGDPESWSVQLTPTSRKIAKRLTGLSVIGDAQSVTSIRINLKDGEWHLMEILRPDLQP